MPSAHEESIDGCGPAASGRSAPGGRWQVAAAMLTIAAVAVMAWRSFDAGDARRWAALATIVVLLGVDAAAPGGRRLVRPAGLRLGIAVLLWLVLAWLGVDGLAIVVLGFVLSAEAMSAVGAPRGWAWIGLLGLLSAIVFVLSSADPARAVLSAFGAFGGYLFMGAAADAQTRAERERSRAARLLGELRIAHAALQASSAQAEALAVAAERERLARELHDTLGHRLTIAAVQLEAIARIAPADAARAAELALAVRAQVADGLAELRAAVAALRDPDERAATGEALARIATGFEVATGIAVDLQVDPALAAASGLPPAVAGAVVRAAQEGLTNVQRHSGARQVWLRLHRGSDGAVLEVRDDGRGIDPASATLEGVGDGGFGWQGLRERAAALGGTLDVGRAAEGGLRLALRVPIGDPGAAEG